MIVAAYAAECCGTVFAPGIGPDTIRVAGPDDEHDAYRRGPCPSCGTVTEPGLTRLFRYPDDFH